MCSARQERSSAARAWNSNESASAAMSCLHSFRMRGPRFYWIAINRTHLLQVHRKSGFDGRARWPHPVQMNQSPSEWHNIVLKLSPSVQKGHRTISALRRCGGHLLRLMSISFLGSCVLRLSSEPCFSLDGGRLQQHSLFVAACVNG